MTRICLPLVRRRTIRLGLCLLLLMVVMLPGAAQSQTSSGEAQWIWNPQQQPSDAPAGDVYFRKTFSLSDPESGSVEITADDSYVLYVNGRHVGAGESWKQLDEYDIKRYMVSGRNVIAVKATNGQPGDAGFVARVTVKNRGNTDVSFSTNGTWLTTLKPSDNWQQVRFNDSPWLESSVLGELGSTEPWGDEIQLATGEQGGRFRAQRNFQVELIVEPEATESLVAMAFNELGEIIASREKGPLIRIRDTNRDGLVDAVTTYCDEIQNCQGILPLNGMVFAVGDGPDGTAFYRLSDEDSDGTAEQIKTLFKFRSDMGEHGPHAPVLGPDGLIYLVVGNHSGPVSEPEPTSPHHGFYEGDLVRPRYEDAGGHAHGVKAPGGIVLRTDVEGSFIELYAGGFRNAYDIAFSRDGDLFTYDSDMEWDEGLPWYRPTRINHIVPGAEFGWRSGWAKWPEYYPDSLPATINVGRGSPTGVVFYNDNRYPIRYHDALFACDWSMGRILAIKMRRFGGTYESRGEVFLTGRPLNVSDLDVGPDGAIYFCTGGRGTEGGIYRIAYTGKIPPPPALRGIMRAIRQPQLGSAWGRDAIAIVQQEMGDDWGPQLVKVAEDTRYPAADRTRALDLMQLVGPFPSQDLLLGLSLDAEPAVRAKCAYLMGIHTSPETGERLIELTADPEPTVCRKALESLVRAGQQAPIERLLTLLASPDRFVGWAARRALERVPVEEWQSIVLESENPHLFVMGSVGLLVVQPEKEISLSILNRAEELMRGFVNDADFIGMLRVIQLALLRGGIEPEEVIELRTSLAEEYPALNDTMNRELVRLLVYLQEPTSASRMLEELRKSEVPLEEKLHLSVYCRFNQNGWSPDQKLELLRFYEYARTLPGGHSFARYIENITRDYVNALNEDERQLVMRSGAEMPGAALTALAHLPKELSEDVLKSLVDLDRDLLQVDSDEARMLSTGVAAVLGRSGQDDAMAYLRDVFEAIPERRPEMAMALAQNPGGENWPLLLRALPVVEGPAAQEVLTKLAQVSRVPEEPEPLRQVILIGLKMDEKQRQHATTLLEKWVGKQPAQEGSSSENALAVWQKWFVETYPNQPAATLPKPPRNSRWNYQQVYSYLTGPEADNGNPLRGKAIFEKGQCIKCHRYGNRGEGIGPDLTTVSQRFHKKEILESIIYPSQVISDQYAAKTVETDGGLTFTGIVGASGEDAIIVLQANGEKKLIPKAEIVDMVPAKISAMPESLLNELTLEEIADLFSYLSKPPVAN
jgi:putative heme-binding domain-containing protein